jgi:hypothetical protein
MIYDETMPFSSVRKDEATKWMRIIRSKRLGTNIKRKPSSEYKVFSNRTP